MRQEKNRDFAAAMADMDAIQDALRESERRFATIFDRAAGGLAVSNAEGRLTMVNDRYCALVGRSREELLRLRIQDITHPDDLPANLARLRRLVDSGEPFALEKRYVRPDGATVWARNEVSLLGEAPNAASPILSVCQDITEVKRAEQLLAEQQALLACTASGRTLGECLESLCEAVSRLAPHARACVLLVDEPPGSMARLAASNLPHDFGIGLHEAPIEPAWLGPCAQALQESRVTGSDDAPVDARWPESWRRRCRENGIHACRAQPVLGASGRPIACLLLAFDEVHVPGAWDERLAAFGAYIASITIERNRADHALRESEERYRSLFESIDEPLCVIELTGSGEGDGEFRFVEGNPAFARHARRPDAHPNFDASCMRNLDPTWIAVCRKVARSGQPLRFEHHSQLAGTWFEVNAFRFGKPGNRKVAVLFRDVTQHRFAEVRDRLRLELSEAMRTFGDPRGVMAQATRVLGKHLGADRVVYAELGADQAHATIEESHSDGLPPLAGRHTLHDLGPALLVRLREGHPYVNTDFAGDPTLGAEQKSAFASMRIRAAVIVPFLDGERLAGVLAVHQASPRAWRNDEIGLVEETARKIWHAVERARAESALRESEAKFRDLADNISQCAWMAEPDGSVFWYNRRWFEYTGGTLEDTRGGGWLKFVHPDHIEPVLERLSRFMGLGDGWEDSFPLRAGNGSYRWFLSRAMPIRDAEGRVVRWFGTSTDIDDQRQAEQSLREADRRKDEFLATLGHELRTPLAPIRNAVQILRTSATTEAQAAAAREMIDRQVRQMVRLLDDLLDISRITVDKLRLRRERIELAAVVHQAVETVFGDIQAAGQQLDVQLPDQPVRLDADPTRLVQVFANLLGNACKYTGRGGRIELQAAVSEGPTGPQLTVRVQDNGIGMPAEFLPKLFIRFSQALPALEHSQGGLGIGLALVRRLVEMHGGSISGHSDGPGRGSEFVVRLPILEHAVREALAEAPNKRHAARKPSRRMLVVDDNFDSAESLATLLRLQGDQVEIAHDGLEALAIAERLRPHVVLLDIGMPKLNGYDTCRVLRTQSWGKNMLVLAQTGWGQDEDRRRTALAGFDGHLVKPVDYTTLLQMLESAGDRKQATEGTA